MRSLTAAAAFGAVLLTQGAVEAAEVTVLASTGFRPILTELAPRFEGDTSHKLAIKYGLLAAFGDHAASRNRRSIRSRPARPNICRLSILSRLICPSVCPLLQPSVTAARTAPSSASSRLANRRRPATGPSCAARSRL